MKKFIVSLACFFLLASAYAQNDLSQPSGKHDTSDFKTVFGSHKNCGKIPLGFFFDLSAGYTMLGSYNAFLPGFSGGVILNHNWSLGLTASMFGVPHGMYYDSIYRDTVGKPMKGAYLHGLYGGLLVEYTLMPKSAVHVSFPLMIGMGYMYFRNPDYSYNHNYSYDYNHNMHGNYTIADTYCFVVEPGVKLEFNLVKMLRMGVAVSYRYSPNYELAGTSKYLLNQFNAKLSFRLGKF